MGLVVIIWFLLYHGSVHSMFKVYNIQYLAYNEERGIYNG